MESIDYQLKKLLLDLNSTVQLARCWTEKDALAKLREQEERVCQLSRTLYAKYVDTVLWRGSIDYSTYQAVLQSLSSALAVLPNTIKNEKGEEIQYAVRESVKARYDDFRSFSARMLDVSQEPEPCQVPPQVVAVPTN